MPQQRIRIAFCIDSFNVGGTEMNALRTAEAIDHGRFDLRILHLQADGPLRVRYQRLGLEMVHLPIPNLYSQRTMAQGLRMSRILLRWGSEVLHSHDIYSNIFSAFWARYFGRCKVITSRRWWHATPRRGLPLLNRVSYALSHRVLANCPSVAQMLICDEHVRRGKIAVVPNFLEEAAFAEPSAEAIAQQRRDWRVPADAFVIGCVARLAPVKNHALLLRAAAPLGDSCHVVLIGGGPLQSDLLHLSTSLGMASRVHFVGEILARQNLHAFFDVSALCSLSEGFPNSVLEALAARRAVVATAVGGIVDIVDNERTGLLVPSNDLPALTISLRRLQSDVTLRARLGAAGCRHVRAHYHQEAVMGALASLYEGLVAGSTAPPALEPVL